LDGASVAFELANGPGDDGLVEIAVAVPPAVRQGRDAVEVGGVHFRLGDE
jgi:hypothetical protein